MCQGCTGRAEECRSCGHVGRGRCTVTRTEKVTATGDVVIIEVKRGDFRDGGGDKDGRDVRVEETVKMLDEDYTLVAFTVHVSPQLELAVHTRTRTTEAAAEPTPTNRGHWIAYARSFESLHDGEECKEGRCWVKCDDRTKEYCSFAGSGSSQASTLFYMKSNTLRC